MSMPMGNDFHSDTLLSIKTLLRITSPRDTVITQFRLSSFVKRTGLQFSVSACDKHCFQKDVISLGNTSFLRFTSTLIPGIQVMSAPPVLTSRLLFISTPVIPDSILQTSLSPEAPLFLELILG